MASADLSTAEKIATLASDGTARKFTYTGNEQFLSLYNAGANAAAIKIGSAPTMVPTAEPTGNVDSEIYLKSGGALPLPGGTKSFYHIADAGGLTTIIVIAEG